MSEIGVIMLSKSRTPPMGFLECSGEIVEIDCYKDLSSKLIHYYKKKKEFNKFSKKLVELPKYESFYCNNRFYRFYIKY